MTMRPAHLHRLTLLALLAAAGCVHNNDASVEVYDVCHPGTDGKKCAPSGGKCDVFLTGTTWMYLQDSDGSDNGLYYFMELRNQRANNANANTGAANTADARVTSYELSFQADGFSIPGYSVSTTTVTVPAAGSTTPFVTLIPPELSPTLRGILPTGDPTLVNIYVRFKGKYVDGGSFETGKFKVTSYVYNAIFPGYACPAGQVVTAVCPNSGQASAVTCEAPL